MKRFSILLLLLGLSASAHAAHDLVLVDFTNRSGRTELTHIAESMQKVFSEKFAPYGVMVIDRSADSNRFSQVSSQNRTILRAEASGDTQTVLRFFLETGDDRKTVVKDIPYAPEEGLDRNLTLVAVKILDALEENILARTQIVTDPTVAALTIDNRIQTETPWESFLTTGRHSCRISKPGFGSIDRDIAVVQGNNRFSFSLVPVTETPKVQPLPGPEASTGESRADIYMAAGILAAAAIGSVISQVAYSSASHEYNALISSNRSDYDALHNKAQTRLDIRNGCFGGGGIAALYLLYRLSQ